MDSFLKIKRGYYIIISFNKAKSKHNARTMFSNNE